MYLLGLLIVDKLFLGSINTLDFTNNLAVMASNREERSYEEVDLKNVVVYESAEVAIKSIGEIN